MHELVANALQERTVPQQGAGCELLSKSGPRPERTLVRLLGAGRTQEKVQLLRHSEVQLARARRAFKLKPLFIHPTDKQRLAHVYFLVMTNKLKKKTF